MVFLVVGAVLAVCVLVCCARNCTSTDHEQREAIRALALSGVLDDSLYPRDRWINPSLSKADLCSRSSYYSAGSGPAISCDENDKITQLSLRGFNGSMPSTIENLCDVERLTFWSSDDIYIPVNVSIDFIMILEIACPRKWPSQLDFSRIQPTALLDSGPVFQLGRGLGAAVQSNACPMIADIGANICDTNFPVLQVLNFTSLHVAQCAKTSSFVRNTTGVLLTTNPYQRAQFPSIFLEMPNMELVIMQGLVDGHFNFSRWPRLQTFQFGQYDPDHPEDLRHFSFTGEVSSAIRVFGLIGCAVSQPDRMWQLINGSVSLSTLELAGSTNVQLPSAALLLPQLLELHLRRTTQLRLPSWIWQLPELQIIDASICSLTSIDAITLPRRPNPLTYVRMSFNELRSLPLWLMQNVQEISVEHNQLQSLTVLPKMESDLRVMDASSNHLRKINVSSDFPASVFFLNVDDNPELNVNFISVHNQFQSTVLSMRNANASKFAVADPAFTFGPPAVPQHGNFSCLTMHSRGLVQYPHSGHYTTQLIAVPWFFSPDAFRFRRCACNEGFFGDPKTRCIPCLGISHVQCNATAIVPEKGHFVSRGVSIRIGSTSCRCFNRSRTDTSICRDSPCASHPQRYDMLYSENTSVFRAGCTSGYSGRLCSRCVCASPSTCFFENRNHQCTQCPHDISSAGLWSNIVAGGTTVCVFLLFQPWWPLAVWFVALLPLSLFNIVSTFVPLLSLGAFLLVRFLDSHLHANAPPFDRVKHNNDNDSDEDIVDDNERINLLPSSSLSINGDGGVDTLLDANTDQVVFSTSGVLKQLIFVAQVLLVLFDGLLPQDFLHEQFESAAQLAKAAFNIHPTGLVCHLPWASDPLFHFLLLMCIPPVMVIVVGVACAARIAASPLRRALSRLGRSCCISTADNSAGKQRLSVSMSLVTGAVLFILNVAYFNVVHNVLSLYSCHRDPILGVSFMNLMPWHRCDVSKNADRYRTLVLSSLPFVVVYVLGFPALLWFLLRRYCGTDVLSNDAVVVVGNFFQPFRDEWRTRGEVVMLVRRLLLSAILALAPAGHPLRGSLFNTILLGFVLFTVVARPRANTNEDWLDVACSFVLLFLGGTLLHLRDADKSAFMIDYAESYWLAMVCAALVIASLIGLLLFSLARARWQKAFVRRLLCNQGSTEIFETPRASERRE